MLTRSSSSAKKPLESPLDEYYDPSQNGGSAVVRQGKKANEMSRWYVQNTTREN